MFIIKFALTALMLVSGNLLSTEGSLYSIRMSDEGIPLLKGSAVVLKPSRINSSNFGVVYAELESEQGGMHELAPLYLQLTSKTFNLPEYQIRFPVHWKNILNESGAYGTENLTYAYTTIKPKEVKLMDPLPASPGECKVIRGNFDEPVQSKAEVLETKVRLFPQPLDSEEMDKQTSKVEYHMTNSVEVSIPEFEYAFFEICSVNKMISGKIELEYNYYDVKTNSSWKFNAHVGIDSLINPEGRVNGSFNLKKNQESFSGKIIHSVAPFKKMNPIYSLRGGKMNINFSEISPEKNNFILAYQLKSGRKFFKEIPNLYQAAIDYLVEEYPSSLRGSSMALPILKPGEKKTSLIKVAGGNLKITLVFN